MSKDLYVKMKGETGIFHDTTFDQSVSGNRPVVVKETPKITKAIDDGILVKITKDEYERSISQLDEAVLESTEALGLAEKCDRYKSERDTFEKRVKVLEAENKKLKADLDASGKKTK